MKKLRANEVIQVIEEFRYRFGKYPSKIILTPKQRCELIIDVEKCENFIDYTGNLLYGILTEIQPNNSKFREITLCL